jgi:hypothetical protein
MAAVLAVILVAVLARFMPPGLPKGRKGAKFSEVFSKVPNVNWLGGAGVPVRRARRLVRRRHPDLFLRRAVGRHARGQPRRLLPDRHLHGVWIILYGAVQAAAPRAPARRDPPEAELVAAARGWAWAARLDPAALTAAALCRAGAGALADRDARGGLLVFGASSRSTPRCIPT